MDNQKQKSFQICDICMFEKGMMVFQGKDGKAHTNKVKMNFVTSDDKRGYEIWPCWKYTQ